MRTATFTAAGAALVGSAAASSHDVHNKLHARDWSDWSSSSSATPEIATSKSATSTWTDPTTSFTPVADWTTSSVKTPAASSTSKTTSSSFSNYWGDWSSSVDPTSSTTTSEYWGDWSSTSKKADPTSSSSSSEYWGDWSSTSKKADPTSSSSSSVYWGDWESTTSSKSADPTTSYVWGDWSSETDPATSTETWEDWSSESGPVTVTTIHTTTTKTVWLGTVSTASASSTETWGDWSSSSVAASSSVPVVVSSVTPSWSSDGWFGPAWPTDPGMCVQQVITSYGAPTWYPTPGTKTVTVTPIASSTAASSSWDDWSVSSSSTKPVVASSSSTSISGSWGDWESTTSSTPAVVTSTSSATWGDWSSSTSASSSTTSSASWGPSTGKSGSGSLSSNGNYFGMTYSPYSSSGGCKDASTVLADLAIIAGKGFTTVRVYSTDCNTLENVGAGAKAHNLKIILGVFISSTGISGAQEQVTDITKWAQWDLVELIVVGNEAVFNGYCSASELAGFISSASWSFTAAGYTGGVTTTEPLLTWQNQGSAFCSVIDVVAANLYAFFNAETTAEKAGWLIQSQIEILNDICPGKETYVMESGWPTAGKCNGVACPSPENQAIALKGIQNTSGSNIVFFSFENEQWKEPGEFGVEQHWGCAGVF